jgi:hypothetical protein
MEKVRFGIDTIPLNGKDHDSMGKNEVLNRKIQVLNEKHQDLQEN